MSGVLRSWNAAADQRLHSQLLRRLWTHFRPSVIVVLNPLQCATADDECFCNCLFFCMAWLCLLEPNEQTKYRSVWCLSILSQYSPSMSWNLGSQPPPALRRSLQFVVVFSCEISCNVAYVNRLSLRSISRLGWPTSFQLTCSWLLAALTVSTCNKVRWFT